jgi:hypothetical protein
MKQRRPTAPIDFDPAEWELLADAARRLGMSRHKLMRLCRSSLAAQGLAAKLRRRRRRPSWNIRRGIDVSFPPPRTCRIPLPATRWGMAALPQEVRYVVGDRMRILEGWWDAIDRALLADAPVELATTAYLVSLGGQISRRTLYNWQRRLRELGAPGLVNLTMLPRVEQPAPWQPNRLRRAG